MLADGSQPLPGSRDCIHKNNFPGAEQGRVEAEHGKTAEITLDNGCQWTIEKKNMLKNTHTQNLIQPELLHVETVGIGAGPFVSNNHFE
jgi:hypothetical protein